MHQALDNYDAVCGHFNMLMRKPGDTETLVQPECTDLEKIERWKLLLDPHQYGYEGTRAPLMKQRFYSTEVIRQVTSDV